MQARLRQLRQIRRGRRRIRRRRPQVSCLDEGAAGHDYAFCRLHHAQPACPLALEARPKPCSPARLLERAPMNAAGCQRQSDQEAECWGAHGARFRRDQARGLIKLCETCAGALGLPVGKNLGR